MYNRFVQFYRVALIAIVVNIMVLFPSRDLQGQETGTKSTESTREVSPEQFRARFRNLIQQQAWTAPRVANPNASTGANVSVVSTLRKQLEAADAAKTRILSTEKTRNAQPAGSPTPTAARGSNSTRGRQAVGSASLSQQATTLICPPGGQPLLRTVDGEKSGVIFTPEVTYRQMALTVPHSYSYTIEGCHFGDVQGSAALVGPFTKGKIDLAIDAWTDGGISVHVPDSVSGELDQDNVTLTLTISGILLQAPGFKFYAPRDEVLLSYVPAKEASLGGPQLRPKFPFYQSHGFGTFDVQRNANTSFAPGTDYFSFDGLQRGFVPVSFQASRYAPLTADQCNYTVNLQGMQISFEGQWNAQWESNRLRIDWPVAHCHAQRGFISYNEWAAWYGVKIWVSGPRGVDPWPANLHVVPPPLYQGPHGF